MKIIKSVELGINIGNFQMVKLFNSYEDECEPKDAEKVAEKLHDACVKGIVKDRNTSLKYLASLVSEEEKKKILESEV